MSYYEKFQSWINEGQSIPQICENLYFNYHSVFSNDEVFKIKKALSKVYNCDIKDIRLTGSAHIGFTYKNNKVEDRENPRDYDFAIINPYVISNELSKISIENVKDSFSSNFVKGKFHPLHADKGYLDSIKNEMGEIQKELGISKSITVCFYLSEHSFIKSLEVFWGQLHADLLSSKQHKGIEPLANLELKPIDKIRR